MFMFNLLFDFSKTDGLFSGDFTGAGSTILDKSKNWLKQPQRDPPDPFNTPHPWEDLLEGTLLVPNPIGEAIGVRIGGLMEAQPEIAAANAKALLELAAQGKLKPRIWRSFPLEQATNAVQSLIDRKVIGKVVLV